VTNANFGVASEAIQKAASTKMDCFVATRLAMTV